MSTDTIVRVDPKTLLVGPNARKEVTLNKEFVDSISELGVRVPITAVETPEGLEVDGQRRTLAAVDLELATVPVYVTEAQTAAERIVDQIVVNQHREDISEKDAIAAVHDLALFDMKTPAIAKKTGLPTAFVHSAVKVGQSTAAREAIDAGKISFEAATTIAEFDEYPEEQKQLVQFAAEGDGYRITNAARQFRDAREEQIVTEQIKAAGVKVVADPGYSGDDPKQVSRLFVDAKMTKRADALTHDDLVKRVGENLRAYTTFEYVEGTRVCTIGYAVAGWAELGFFGHLWGGTSNKPSTPEEAEALKLERRAARESTKEWVAATALRREFVGQLVQRKTMPKGWETLVAARLLDNGSHGPAEWKAAIAFLGLNESKDSYSLRGVVETHAKKNGATAMHAMLATALAAVEGAFEFDKKGWKQKSVATPYLRLLEEWGYVLSDVEGAVLGRKPRKVAAAA